MTERDTDIDFDFFDDESETREQPSRLRRVTARGPRRARKPPTGLGPLLRLAALVAFAIAVVVLLVFWVQSCQGESKRSGYESYLRDIATIGSNSQRIGANLSRELTQTGVRQAQLGPPIDALAQRQQQDILRAQAFDPPAALRAQHGEALEALQFRRSGLEGLADTFRQTAKTAPEQTGQLLAQQAQRLVTSDIVWDDRFMVPVRQELQRQEITGIPVPDSNFVQTIDLDDARSMTAIVRRLRGTPSTGGGSSTPAPGRHGTALVSVRAQPSGQELTRTGENVITATPALAFEATVENQGESQEVQVRVRLTIPKRPDPIDQTKAIALINEGERETVRFGNLSTPPFDRRVDLRVEVLPVDGERITTNNSQTYVVQFSVG